ncbi:hypothetical protein HYT02_05685 [Candidatus Gottesmanbacteria bacterium]|nr:hypothetical protein [Candidatus Gottesmanbacteria bacterium]
MVGVENKVKVDSDKILTCSASDYVATFSDQNLHAMRLAAVGVHGRVMGTGEEINQGTFYVYAPKGTVVVTDYRVSRNNDHYTFSGTALVKRPEVGGGPD